MQISFTPAGGATTYLVDHTAAPKIQGLIENFGGQALIYAPPLYGAAFRGNILQGNVTGKFIFTATCSYATLGAAAVGFKTAYNFLNQSGTLELIYGAATLTMASATCQDVQRLKWDGVLLQLRYTFGISAIV